MSSEAMVDWTFAARAGGRLVKPGPKLSLNEAKAVVAELRDAAARADDFVSQVTEIAHPAHSAPTLVIDRNQWIETNAASIGTVMDPLITKLAQQSSSAAVTRAVGGKVTGAEAGALLAFLSSRVLGQFDVFGSERGSLLLVAPNIVDAERRLEVSPSDFRLWVCIHEVTHRLQFTAFPWLNDYLRSLIKEFVEASEFDSDVLKERLRETLGALRERRSSDEPSEGLLGLVRDPAQRDVLERMTAVMSLLEGHAEFVMDEVGPSVIPSVVSIRRKFAKRRKGKSPVDRLLRKLLGLEAKMRQYADGRTFVDGVVAEIGMSGFNHVFSGPEALPLRGELTDPGAYLARVQANGHIQAAESTYDAEGVTTRTFRVGRSGDHVPLNEAPEIEREIVIERRTGE